MRCSQDLSWDFRTGTTQTSITESAPQSEPQTLQRSPPQPRRATAGRETGGREGWTMPHIPAPPHHHHHPAPRAWTPPSHRNRETSPVQPGLPLPAEKGGGQAHLKPALLAELLASLPKPGHEGSATSRAALLPEDSQAHFCPTDALKIESVSVIVLQANIERLHPRCYKIYATETYSNTDT